MDEESELPRREQELKGCTSVRSKISKQQSSRRAQPTNEERPPPPDGGMTCEKGERNSGETDPTVMVNAKGEGQIKKSLLF